MLAASGGNDNNNAAHLITHLNLFLRTMPHYARNEESEGRKMPSQASLEYTFFTIIAVVCFVITLVREEPHPQGQSALHKALTTSKTVSTLKPLDMVQTSGRFDQEIGEPDLLQEAPKKSAPLKQEAPLERKAGFPGSKSVVAYAISITSCEINATTVFDGPAILSHSIHQTSIRHNHTSKYDYSLYAFLHPDAAACTDFLEYLGYNILIRDLPFDLKEIQSESYQKSIEEDGCCGSREFLKLWAYTLSNHDIVVHTDTDVMFLKPMDEVYDSMLDSDTSQHSLPAMFGAPLPKKIDFVFTRDYLQRSRLTKDPTKYGVQGGFFVLRPDAQVFDEMKAAILKGDYEQSTGWGNLMYGGYWGSPQIQGFLSYFYGALRPEHAMELNRCYYNTMVDDPPEVDGKCRTGETSCQDCRETPLSEMVTVHLTTCWKPWHCPTLKAPHPARCKEVHRAWFDLRQSLELSWGYEVPTDGWWFPRTLGYCTKKKPIKKRFYLPLQIPNMTKREPNFFA